MRHKPAINDRNAPVVHAGLDGQPKPCSLILEPHFRITRWCCTAADSPTAASSATSAKAVVVKPTTRLKAHSARPKARPRSSESTLTNGLQRVPARRFEHIVEPRRTSTETLGPQRIQLPLRLGRPSDRRSIIACHANRPKTAHVDLASISERKRIKQHDVLRKHVVR